MQSNPIDSTRSRELPVLDERAVECFQQCIAGEGNKRLHHDKDSGQMSFLSRERGSCEPSHEDHCNYTYSRPIQHCVCWHQRDDVEYATSMGAGVGECDTLCRECTGRQNGVASMVARTAESGGHNRAYPGRVSVLEVRSTCSLPSEADAVLDYLRTSGIESGQDHVKCDRDLPSYEQFVYALLAIKCVAEPQTDKQAIASGEAAQWVKAMASEIQYHEDNETRKYGIDYTEIFASVVRMEIIRLLLALAAAMDWEVEQMDVKSAFLNGYLDEEIYMEQPVGYVQRGKECHVCVLRKSLYGLKQAPRVWYYTFYEVMIAEKLIRLVKGHCVFVKTRGGEICIVVVDVNNLLVIGTKPFVAEIKEILKRRFQMTDLVRVSYLLR
ncbi:unnamed protein product [Phytophthora fragariaefolia]|uniref:Unnamed protein product n=1 Tax=Phytophthora fragariaefolia TaxID=1490495 RepID=A0A9W6Y2M3_9STRA|nr:unnamed protein product [Phytophthora fragariaefolia]